MLSPFTTAKALSAQCGLSPSTVRKYIDQMEKLDRYKDCWVIANTSGTKMVNVLAWDDFIFYRGRIEAGLSKHLPPYNPKTVLQQRGE